MLDAKTITELEVEIAEMELRIKELEQASDVLSRHGVPFTSRQEAVLEWYHNRLWDVGHALLPCDDL